MKKQLITVQDGGGMPLGSLFVEEECAGAHSRDWFKGSLRFAIYGSGVDLHVFVIGVTRVKTGDITDLVPLDPMFKDDVTRAYDLNGGGVPATLTIEGIEYVVLVYPYAE